MNAERKQPGTPGRQPRHTRGVRGREATWREPNERQPMHAGACGSARATWREPTGPRPAGACWSACSGMPHAGPGHPSSSTGSSGCSTPCPCTGISPPSPRTDTGASGLAPVLRERLASAGDSLIAMGCTGACQPVLGLEELDREIAWGVRNPWSTGLADVLGRRPAAIAPRLADLDRPGAAALFLRHGLALVGTAAADRPLAFSGHYGVRVFPYTRLPLEGAGRQSLDADLRRLMAALRRRLRDDRPRRAAPRTGRGSPPDRDRRRAGPRIRAGPSSRSPTSRSTARPGSRRTDAHRPRSRRGTCSPPRPCAGGSRRPKACAAGAAGAATRRATCSPALRGDPRSVRPGGEPSAALHRPRADRPHAGRGDALGRHLRRAPRGRTVLRAGPRPRSAHPPASGRLPAAGRRQDARRPRPVGVLVRRRRRHGTPRGPRPRARRLPRGRLHVPRRPSLPRRRGILHPPRPRARAVVEEWTPLVLRARGGAAGPRDPGRLRRRPTARTARASWRSGTAGGRRPVPASA